jgi:hypothetical protein
MSISKVFSTGSEIASAGATLTSATFDSTGYTHIVCFTKHEVNNASGATCSDNKSSPAFTKLQQQQVGGGNSSWGELHYVKIGSPGTGHTVTLTTNAATEFRTLLVWLVNATSGEIDLVDEEFANGTGTAVDAGSLINALSESIVSFMGVAEFVAATWTPGTGWTEDWDDGSAVNSTLGQSRGAETTSPIDPVATASASMDWAALAASFRESTALPVITVQPINQIIADGVAGTFSITASGATSYQWETQAPGGGTWSNVTGGSGATTANYTTPTLSKASDAGRNYRCKATNVNGTTTSNAGTAFVTSIPASYSASVGFVIGSNA